jgi:predicted ATPase/DNA-binding SARP family transcriptional activator
MYSKDRVGEHIQGLAMVATRESCSLPLQAVLLGPVHLAVGDRALPVNAWPRRSARTLLLLLLAHPTHRLPRDRVLDLLWPDATPDTANASLRKAVHGLRRVLEPALRSGRASAYIEVAGETVGLRPDAARRIDVDLFEQTLAAASPSDPGRLGHLRSALSLYDGHLLAEEPDSDWIVPRREALRCTRRRAILTLADLETGQGEPLAAAHLLESLLVDEPGDEAALRALLQSLLAAGQRDEALRRYHQAAAALQADLDTEPSEETQALIAEISAGRWTPVSAREKSVRIHSPVRYDALPTPPNALIGRGREIESILALLWRAGVSLVTLTGPGGTGKTRLALEVAARAMPDFAAGVCVVPLAALSDHRLVMPAVVRALGFEESAGHSVEKVLHTALRDRELLLVLDNVEHVIEAGPAIAELLAACPRLKILATSREPLKLRAEHLYPTPPLTVPALLSPVSLDRLAGSEAVELFVERARAVRPEFALTHENAPVIAELCARLDGLPLAIELAAARARGLPAETLLAWMGRRLSLLTDGARDHPRRLQTMRDAIAWSYDLLTGAQQGRFRRLAVFAGGFTPEAAEAVVTSPTPAPAAANGAEPSDFKLDAFMSLVDKSLVRRSDRDGESRFELLETIRAFGLERLIASGEYASTRQAHAAYYLALAERANLALDGPQQIAWLDQLEIEHDNARAAIEWASEHADADLALRLCSALWRFWIVRGYLVEGRARIDQALALPPADPLNAHRAAALARAGDLARRCGDFDGASTSFQESIAIWQHLDNRTEEAWVYTEVGCLALANGDYPGARASLNRSLAMQRGASDQSGMARSLLCLGRVAHHTGDDNRAKRLAEASLASFRSANDRIGVIWALHSLIHYAIDLGDLFVARTFLDEAIANTSAIGYHCGAIALLEAGAALAAAEDAPVRAMRLAGAATALREPIGVPLPPDWRGDVYRQLSSARDRLGEPAAHAAWSAGRLLEIDHALVEACSIDPR